MTAAQALDGVYSALADPTRRAIVVQLTRGEATVSELALPHSATFQAISQHIKVLENAGLVSRGRVGRTRPCRLEPAALDLATSWIEQARSEWSGRIDRLERHIAKIKSKPRSRRGD
jgi:DNA-binding transcriptional ArsR family regulator